jgi:histidinol-phosphatase
MRLGHTLGVISDLELALELADRAAEMSLVAFEERNFEVERKPDSSLVTSCDKAIEVALREMLARERPKDDIVGEEFGGQPTDGRCWYLDPIDGTSGFVEGTNHWGTLIALAEEGLVTTSVVDLPIQKRRCWAARGQGAFAGKSQLQVSTVATLSEATVCDDYLRNIEHRTPGHRLVYLAERSGGVHPNDDYPSLTVAGGRADIFLASDGGSWDRAPFVLLVEEAGGRVSDLEGRRRFEQPPVLFTNGRIHDQCLAVMRESESP